MVVGPGGVRYLLGQAYSECVLRFEGQICEAPQTYTDFLEALDCGRLDYGSLQEGKQTKNNPVANGGLSLFKKSGGCTRARRARKGLGEQHVAGGRACWGWFPLQLPEG